MNKPLIDPETVFSASELTRLKRWIRIYESMIGKYMKRFAFSVFADFDRQYFQRAGLTEEDYLNGLIAQVRKNAFIAFTEMPNGSNRTAFHFPENKRQAAYKKFEAEAVSEFAIAENRVKNKAYIARRLGLKL
jgi:hypothetical protein